MHVGNTIAASAVVSRRILVTRLASAGVPSTQTTAVMIKLPGRGVGKSFGELRVISPSSDSLDFRSDAYPPSKILHGLENSLRVLDPFSKNGFQELGAF